METVKIEDSMGNVKEYKIEFMYYSFRYKKHYMVCSDDNDLFAFKFSTFDSDDYEFVDNDEELKMIMEKINYE